MRCQKGWIAYVGPFPFPSGVAGSKRMLGVALSLQQAGYQVVVGSGETAPLEVTSLGGDNSARQVGYIGLGELPPKGASVLQKARLKDTRTGFAASTGFLPLMWVD